MISDYLTWARDTDAWLHACPDAYDLFSSAIYEPTDMVLEDSRRAMQTDLADRLHDCSAWGHSRIVAALSQMYGISDERRLLPTTGCSIAFFLVCRALLSAGDQAVVEIPVYQPFLKVLDSLGVEAIPLHRSGPDFAFDLDDLRTLITPRTKLIILTNLHNPSGMILSDATLRDLAAAAHRTGVKILIDEVFHDFARDVQPPAASLDDAFITINSFSKVYGLSIFRCGRIQAAPEIMTRIRPVHVIFDNSGSRLTQSLASAALEDFEKYRLHTANTLAKNRPLVEAFAADMQAEGLIEASLPQHGCIFFPRLIGVDDTQAFARQLMERQRVVVVPGEFFGAPGHIRVGFGSRPDRLQAGLDRLAEGIKQNRL